MYTWFIYCFTYCFTLSHESLYIHTPSFIHTYPSFIHTAWIPLPMHAGARWISVHILKYVCILPLYIASSWIRLCICICTSFIDCYAGERGRAGTMSRLHQHICLYAQYLSLSLSGRGGTKRRQRLELGQGAASSSCLLSRQYLSILLPPLYLSPPLCI